MTSRAVLLLFVLTGAWAVDRTVAPEPDASSSVRAARIRWNAAVVRRDSNALAGLVDDSAVHVSPRFTHLGRSAYLTVFLHNMAARPEFRLVYQPDRVRACEQAPCRIATESGTWKETWVEQGEPTEVGGTYYAIWRRNGDVWQIRAEAFATLTCRGQQYCGSSR